MANANLLHDIANPVERQQRNTLRDQQDEHQPAEHGSDRSEAGAGCRRVTLDLGKHFATSTRAREEA
jgi:hypothetical protein